VQRWNMLHPTEEKKLSHVEKLLKDAPGPVIASTDYVRALTEQIRAFVPQKFVVLGTDGYGRSDNRAQLRHHFEVDAAHIVLASLKALADEGKLDMATVKACMKKFNLDPDKPSPVTQ
jgi:pyruvate dehydrogenase E1 component